MGRGRGGCPYAFIIVFTPGNRSRSRSSRSKHAVWRLGGGSVRFQLQLRKHGCATRRCFDFTVPTRYHGLDVKRPVQSSSRDSDKTRLEEVVCVTALRDILRIMVNTSKYMTRELTGSHCRIWKYLQQAGSRCNPHI